MLTGVSVATAIGVSDGVIGVTDSVAVEVLAVSVSVSSVGLPVVLAIGVVVKAVEVNTTEVNTIAVAGSVVAFCDGEGTRVGVNAGVKVIIVSGLAVALGCKAINVPGVRVIRLISLGGTPTAVLLSSTATICKMGCTCLKGVSAH